MEQLCATIVAHYTVDKLRQIVKFRLDKDLETITLGPDKEAIVFTLVDWSDREGRLALLLAGLLAGNPHPDLAAACEAILAPRAMINPNTGPEACQALLITELPPLPMINRQDLRSYLRQLAAPDSAFRAISVSGPRASGKSHCYYLLAHVAQTIGCEIALVDLTPPLGPRSVIEVIESITAQMRLPAAEIDTHVLKDQPKDERLSRKFADWLAGYSRAFVGRGERWWLVFDGLDRPEATTVRELFVPYLLFSVAQSRLKNTAIMLLGDNAQRVVQARWCALHENARQLDRQDLRAFLSDYAAAKSIALRPDELEDMTNFVGENRPGPYDHEAMETITPRLRQVLADVLR
jgi:Effector-associated domain 1